MANSKLPLRIKVDVRDHFDAQTCPVQNAFKNLEDVVGLKVTCNVEWDLLFHALENSFPDSSTFVPNVAATVVAWCHILSTRLEDDRFAAWTEDVVGKLENKGLIKLQLQASNVDRPTTSWSENHSSFLIYFPSAKSVSPQVTPSGFETDFQNLFSKSEATTTAQPPTFRNNEDEWAEIDETGEASSIVIAKTPSTNVRPEKLPIVTTIPTPDILLRTLTPYILHVSLKGGGTLNVKGTHGPSLVFLSEYLKRWIKKDHQDVRKVPLLQITLHESHFGLGLSYDALTIEPFETNQQRRGIEMNPTIILTIVENILGYHRQPQVSQGFWEFRRNVPFE